MGGEQASLKLAELCRHNAGALCDAIGYCAAHGIGAFRINSQILPLKTHPATAYEVGSLPGGREIVDRFLEAGSLAARLDVRLLFHPDQFVVLSSENPEITARSVLELEYQAEVAEWVGADVINLHAGGAYGDKRAALRRVAANTATLSKACRERLTFENDDRVYTPCDLMPMCERLGQGMVYDVHHHRCNPDAMTEEEATDAAALTWDREQVVHLSSPRQGWRGANRSYHRDYISSSDFPRCWLGRCMTVEVEAKAKELAVARLRRWLLASSGAARRR